VLSHQAWEYEKPLPGGIVVGLDGSDESLAALKTAAAIARQHRYALHIVSVLHSFPSYRPDDEDAGQVDDLRATLKLSEVKDALGSVNGETNGWTCEVLVGRPARMVVSIAEHRAAELIVVGRRRHSAVDRLLGGETTLQVMRMSTIPVLAAHASAGVPRKAVAAIDFSPASIRAAKIAKDLLGDCGTLYLAYVEPPEDLLPQGFVIPGEGHYLDAEARFKSVLTSLDDNRKITVETAELSGKPTAAITDFAERVGADLITAGSHGHSRLDRFLLGSVTTGIVRNATCSVLVVPALK
jgi:nucleotide-binding universal stress UspA family protein